MTGTDPASAVASAGGVSDRDVVLRFESLGGAGCGHEFGLFQRQCGAEPLGLLRWADISADLLSRALEKQLDGVGEEQHTIVYTPEDGSEWWTRDRRYWMAMRSFISTGYVSRDDMLKMACRRLGFLRGKLVEDLRAGSKIFVYRNASRNLLPVEIERLHRALRLYGNGTLFCLHHADEAHPAGSVERLREGVLIGYVDPVGRVADGRSAALPEDLLLGLCRRALAMTAGDNGPTAAGPSADTPAEPPPTAAPAAGPADAAAEALCRQARGHVDAGWLDEALEAASQAVRLRPRHGGGRRLRSDVLLRRGSVREATLEALAAAVLEPRHAQGHVHLGIVLHRAGDAAGAEAAYAAAATLAPGDASILQELSALLRQQRRYPEALAAAERAAALEPGSPQRLEHLAMTLMDNHRHEEASAVLHRVLALAPDSTHARIRLSDLHTRLGRSAEALAEIEVALARDPRSVRAHVHMAHVRRLRNEPAQAAATLRRALVLEPENAQLLQLLADLPQEARDDPQAA